MSAEIPHWLESQIDRAVRDRIRGRAKRERVTLAVAAARELADLEAPPMSLDATAE